MNKNPSVLALKVTKKYAQKVCIQLSAMFILKMPSSYNSSTLSVSESACNAHKKREK